MNNSNPDRSVNQATSHEEIKEFYDRSYYADPVVQTIPSRHLRAMARRLGLAKDKRVLDVACGRGAWLLAARERGCIVAGIDLSDNAVSSCQAAIPGADVRQGAAETLPWPDDLFDFVTCLGSLEHFLDPTQSIREMVRVAKPDATFVLLVPNSGFLTRRLGLYGGTNQAGVREVVRSLDEWSDLLFQGGLRIEKRWKDLHVLSGAWIFLKGPLHAPMRALQALMLACWPIKFQYQVYHLCKSGKGDNASSSLRNS